MSVQDDAESLLELRLRTTSARLLLLPGMGKMSYLSLEHALRALSGAAYAYLATLEPYSQQTHCPWCRGTGVRCYYRDGHHVRCDACQGTGREDAESVTPSTPVLDRHNW